MNLLFIHTLPLNDEQKEKLRRREKRIVSTYGGAVFLAAALGRHGEVDNQIWFAVILGLVVAAAIHIASPKRKQALILLTLVALTVLFSLAFWLSTSTAMDIAAVCALPLFIWAAYSNRLDAVRQCTKDDGGRIR